MQEQNEQALGANAQWEIQAGEYWLQEIAAGETVRITDLIATAGYFY